MPFSPCFSCLETKGCLRVFFYFFFFFSQKAIEKPTPLVVIVITTRSCKHKNFQKKTKQIWGIISSVFSSDKRWVLMCKNMLGCFFLFGDGPTV